MRREFIVNVSHELKTPIALIQGYAEGLTAGVADDPEDRKFYCDTIADEAGHMNRLVMQLLSLSKLELGADLLRGNRPVRDVPRRGAENRRAVREQGTQR